MIMKWYEEACIITVMWKKWNDEGSVSNIG